MIDLHHLPGTALCENKFFVFRRHPITLVPLVLAVVLIFCLPPAVYAFLPILKPGLFENQAYQALFVMAASAFFLFGWLFTFQMFIEYWLDVLIVTEKRILDIDQSGLFGRTVSELRLYQTQDVTAEVHGILHTLLDYGDIYIQTAGEKQRFHFQDVAHPNQIAKMILGFVEADRKEHFNELAHEQANGAA